MKFRQKIFLITFIFVTISIILIGVITINNNYNKLINSRIEANISSIYNIESMLKFYNASEINSNLFNRENTYYEISKNDSIIYTNLFQDQRNIEDIVEPSNNQIKAIIFDKMLYMSAKGEDFKIILAENIEDVFENRQEQIDFFIKISILFSFIISFCLYIIIFLLTRRIDKLDKATKQIQNGDYSTRVKNLGNDEIGNLGASFNQMIESVDKNIKEIQRVSENRKNFIHDMTHEIITPLTSIIGYSSLIRNKKVQDIKTIIDYNDKIYEEGIYLNLISQRLIDIILLENKKIELEDINISRSIRKIIESTKSNIKDVSFINNIEENIIIKSDETLLHSLVMNILKNAVTACNHMDTKIIEIFLNKAKDGQIVLKIKDNR